MIADQHFLGKRQSKCLSTIVQSYPDIGTTIVRSLLRSVMLVQMLGGVLAC